MGDIKTLNLGFSSHDSLFRVPGTELYIFNCPDRETIELWHLGWRRMVGEPIKSSARFFDVSSGVDLPGKFMMGFLSKLTGLLWVPFLLASCPNFDRWSRYKVFVICVEYGPNNASLNLVLQDDFFGNFHWGLYLDKDFVGTLCNQPSTNELSIVSVNLSTREKMFVRTVIPSFVSTYTYYSDFYESKWIYRIFLYSVD